MGTIPMTMLMLQLLLLPLVLMVIMAWAFRTQHLSRLVLASGLKEQPGSAF